MTDATAIDVVVIGAGQAGLAASWHLSHRGIEHVVLERGRVGETWRSERWDSFALNTPNWMNVLPGETHSIEPRDAFLTRDALIDRFDAYAAVHRLPIRTSTSVTAVEPDGRPRRLRVTTGEPDVGTFVARHVIVASGGQGRPRLPSLADAIPTSIRQLHSAAYRAPAGLPDGAVLVVGSGQSGVQIAEDLVAGDRRVYLCTSAVGRLRRRQRGRDSLEWLTENGFYDVTPDQLPDPRMLAMPIPQISGVGRLGHTVSLQSLADLGVTLLGRPLAVDGARVALDDSLGGNIAVGDRVSAALNGRVERRLRERGAMPPPLEPDPADAPHPDPLSVHGPSVLDLDVAGISTVLWATGFTPAVAYLHVPVLDDAGNPVHDRGAARVPGVHFLGLRWLTDRKSALLLSAASEAAVAVQRVADDLGGAA